jgi:DNA-binding MarR family transcriptional regulator
MTDDRALRGRGAAAGGAAPSERAVSAVEPLGHLAGYAALRAHLVLRECFEQAIGGPMALRPVEFTLLCRLAAEGPMPAKALAEALALHAPNLTTIVERLAERGLVSRERNRLDRRSVLIALTPAGRRLQRRALDVSRTMEDERLSVLSPAEREQFRALAWRIVDSGAAAG